MQRAKDSLNRLRPKRNQSINNSKMAIKAPLPDPGTKGQLFECMPLSSPLQRQPSVPSCLLSCSSCHWALLEGTSLVTASWDRLLSPDRPRPPLTSSGSGPSIQLSMTCSPTKGPHHNLSSASVTQQSLMNTGKACCICLTRVFQWQTSPLRKIYQTEMRYITEFLQSKTVTSVSQSAVLAISNVEANMFLPSLSPNVP